MQIIKLNLSEYDTQMHEEKRNVAYLLNLEIEDALFQALNNNGIDEELLIAVASGLDIPTETMIDYEYAAVQGNGMILQLYFFPKTASTELKQEIIKQHLIDIDQLINTINKKQETDQIFYPSHFHEEDEEEEEEGWLYCYKFNYFSELNKIPITNGSIVKDENNQKYLFTDNILHDFLEETDFPDYIYLILDDVVKILR